jgi:hypothetical protein
MEFSNWRAILLIVLSLAMENSTFVQAKDFSGPVVIVQQQTEDSVNVNGTILDSITGVFPRNDSVVVKIDSSIVFPDTEGTFIKRVPQREYHSLGVF